MRRREHQSPADEGAPALVVLPEPELHLPWHGTRGRLFAADHPRLPLGPPLYRPGTADGARELGEAVPVAPGRESRDAPQKTDEGTSAEELHRKQSADPGPPRSFYAAARSHHRRNSMLFGDKRRKVHVHAVHLHLRRARGVGRRAIRRRVMSSRPAHTRIHTYVRAVGQLRSDTFRYWATLARRISLSNGLLVGRRRRNRCRKLLREEREGVRDA